MLRHVRLAPGDALWLEGRPEALDLRAADPGARLVSIAIGTATGQDSVPAAIGP